MSKEKLIEIYQDTQKLCESISVPGSVKHTAPLTIGHTYEKKGIVTVEPLDTVSALVKYYNQYSRLALLNMASSKRPGGNPPVARVRKFHCVKCKKKNNMNIGDFRSMLSSGKIDGEYYREPYISRLDWLF